MNSKTSTGITGRDPIKQKVTRPCATAHNDMKMLLNNKKSSVGWSSFFICDIGG